VRAGSSGYAQTGLFWRGGLPVLWRLAWPAALPGPVD
jgi:hypothetical protein